MTAICASRSFWVAASALRRVVASARATSSAASCASIGAQSRRLGQGVAPVLELRDGGVGVLHGEQVLEVEGVGHASAS